MALFRRWYTLKDGSRSFTWNYEFEVHGHRHRGSFGHVSKTTANDLHAREYAHALEGVRPNPRKRAPVLQEFVPAWLTWYAGHASPASVASHRYHWKAVKPVLGQKRLDELT